MDIVCTAYFHEVQKCDRYLRRDREKDQSLSPHTVYNGYIIVPLSQSVSYIIVYFCTQKIQHQIGDSHKYLYLLSLYVELSLSLNQ
jgi:hypothetical protein